MTKKWMLLLALIIIISLNAASANENVDYLRENSDLTFFENQGPIEGEKEEISYPELDVHEAEKTASVDKDELIYLTDTNSLNDLNNYEGLYAGYDIADSSNLNYKIPLEIIKVIPAPNIVDVPLDTPIRVTFNQTPLWGTGWIRLRNVDQLEDVLVTSKIIDQELHIIPLQYLKAETNYRIMLHTNSLTSLEGQPLSLYQSHFKTRSLTPLVTTINPAPDSVNVALDALIRVTFNNPLQWGTRWIRLRDVDRLKDVSITTQIIDNELHILPHSNLMPQTRYRVMIHTNSLKSLAGNPISLYQSLFKTRSSSLLVTRVVPSDGAAKVPLDTKIEISFSEPINWGNRWIRLRHMGLLVDIPLNMEIVGEDLYLTPLIGLNRNINYRIIIHTAAVTSLTGEPLHLFESQFTTITYYTIETFDSTVGADVRRNPEIRKHIPLTPLSNQIFEYQKKGSSILEFGDGNGPKLLIIAGIHGNEAASNISVMKYLEYLKDKNFQGTIYAIPFAIPHSTSINSRLWEGEDPNRIANIYSTPGWKLVQFAKNQGVTHILDVHSGGGVAPYGQGLIFYNPNRDEEIRWSNYIKDVAGSHMTGGIPLPGMIRGYANQLSIDTITLEVERDIGCTLHWANVQFQMIKAASTYLFPVLI